MLDQMTCMVPAAIHLRYSEPQVSWNQLSEAMPSCHSAALIPVAVLVTNTGAPFWWDPISDSQSSGIQFSQLLIPCKGSKTTPWRSSFLKNLFTLTFLLDKIILKAKATLSLALSTPCPGGPQMFLCPRVYF